MPRAHALLLVPVTTIMTACASSAPPLVNEPVAVSIPAVPASAAASPPAAAPSPAPAPPPPAPRDAQREAAACLALRRSGAALHDAGRYDDALAAYQKGFDQCGPGFGFQGEMAYTLMVKGDLDGAVDRSLAEVGAPAPSRTSFGNLASVLPKLSKAALQKVMSAGASAEAPIFVPDIGGEYVWAEQIGCGVTGGKVALQALIQHGDRSLDLLDYTCPDGSKHTTYFDYSADPREQAMMKELGGRP